MDSEQLTAVGRTRSALLLLAVAALLDPIPIANYIGGILAIVGAILMILGRRAFGEIHSRNVIWSVVIYVVGLIIAFIVAISFASSIASIELSGAGASSASEALSAAFNGLFIGLIITGAVLGIATILFTFAIQDRFGRVLLLAGYLSSLSIGILVFSIIGSQVTTALGNSGSLSSAIGALQSQANLLRLLGFIPAIIYATAYLRVRQRIDRGEIPSPP